MTPLVRILLVMASARLCIAAPASTSPSAHPTAASVTSPPQTVETWHLSVATCFDEHYTFGGVDIIFPNPGGESNQQECTTLDNILTTTVDDATSTPTDTTSTPTDTTLTPTDVTSTPTDVTSTPTDTTLTPTDVTSTPSDASSTSSSEQSGSPPAPNNDGSLGYPYSPDRCPSPPITLGFRRGLIGEITPTPNPNQYFGDGHDCLPDIPQSIGPYTRLKGRRDLASLTTMPTARRKQPSDLTPREHPIQMIPWYATPPNDLKETEANRALQGAIYIGYAIREFFNVSSSFLRSKTGEEHCLNCDISGQISIDENERITNLQKALPPGVAAPADCKDFGFSIEDQDDYTRQANIVLSIGGSGILSLMDALSITKSELANGFINAYTTAFANFSQQMQSSHDFVTPRIPPAWALSWAAQLGNQKCQTPAFDINVFHTLEVAGDPRKEIVTSVRLKSNDTIAPNVTIQWVGVNKLSFSSPSTPVPGDAMQVDTQIPGDKIGTFFAAVVDPSYDLADIDHKAVSAGPAVVLIR